MNTFTRPNHESTGLTSVPDWRQAIADAAALTRDAPEEQLGTIVISMRPAPAFYRLPPESSKRLQSLIVDRLRGCLRPNDRLYTLAPREWLLVLPRLRSSSVLVMAMLKLRERFETDPFHIDGTALRLSIACGAATFPDDGEDALHLVQSAQIACLAAIQRGTGNAVFDPEMDELDETVKALDQEARLALNEGNRLALHLQPQIATAGGRCVGAEALLRWQRISGEWVSPPVLLASIERLGLRQRFTQWLLLTACRSARQISDAGLSVPVSINLSANDLLDVELPVLIAQALNVWSLTPAAIQIEITETSMVQETETVLAVLQSLRDMGVGLSVDDFGTGYSSMSNLKSLPVREVKIDQSFIQHLENSETDRAIVAAMITLAHRLGLHVVAEGVETESAAALLGDMNCDRLQGFLFSPAMPLESFIAWHQSRAVTQR